MVSSGIDHAVIWNSRASPNGNPLVPQGIGAGATAHLDTVYLRLIPSDLVGGQTFTGLAATVGPFTVDNTSNAPPSIQIASPSGTLGGDVLVPYTLFDGESDPCELVVEFNAGAGFIPATAGSGGNGMSNLVSDPTGTAHVFSWDSVTDKVALSATSTSVVLRLAGRGIAQGVFATSSVMTLDNQVYNQPPTLVVVAPSGTTTGDSIGLPLFLSDVESDLCTIEVQYQDAAGSWRDATADPGSPTTGLSTSASGDLHTFVWQSLTDGVAPSRATVQMQARVLQPSPARTGSFVPFSVTVDNGNVLNTPPVIAFVDAGPPAVLPEDYDVYLLVRDAESDPVEIDNFSFTLNGTAWLTATTDISGAPLATSPAGQIYLVAWDAATDIALAKDLLGSTPIPMLSLRAGVHDVYGLGNVAVYNHDLGLIESVPTSSPPLTPISTVDSSSGLVSLVAGAGNGVFHAFWVTPFGSPPYTLRHAISRDTGASWAASTSVATASNNGGTAISAPGSALLVAYSTAVTTTQQLRVARSTNAGSTWPTIINMTTAATNAEQPYFYHETGTIVHLVWRDYAASASTVYHSRSVNGGATWSAGVAVSSAEAGVQFADPTVGVTGSTIHVIWRGASAIVKHSMSINAGANWSAPVTLFNDGGSFSDPSLLATPDGTLHLTTYVGQNFGPRYMRRSPAGVWEAPRSLDNRCFGPPFMFYDSVEQEIQIYYLWYDAGAAAPFASHVVVSKDLGDTFSAPTTLIEDAWRLYAREPLSGLVATGAAGQFGLPAVYPFAVPLPRLSLPRRLANSTRIALGFDRAGSLLSSWRGSGPDAGKIVLGGRDVPWTRLGDFTVAGPSPIVVAGGAAALFTTYVTDLGFGGPNPFFGVAGSADGGQTWNPLNSGGRAGSFAVDELDRGYLVALSPAAPGTPTALQIQTSVDAGANWTAASLLTGLGTLNNFPSLLWLNNRLRMAYVDTSGTFDVVRYSDSATGATWIPSPGTNVSQNGSRDASFAQLVGGAHGRLHIVWAENTGTAWQLRRSTSVNDGATWSAPVDAGIEQLCTACLSTLNVTVDPAGDLFVGWSTGTPTNLVSTAVMRAGTWGEAARHGTGGAPSLASNVDGAYVGWSSGTDAYVRVLRRHHVLHASPAASLPIPDNNPSGVRSTIEIADGGSLHDVGVWVDLTHGNTAQLTVTVTSPGGSVFTLNPGAPAAMWNGPIMFTDSGIAAAPALSSLSATSLVGVWTLHVVDSTAGASGTLRDWGLRFR